MQIMQVRRVRRIGLTLALVALVTSPILPTTSCAKAPPTLSPSASAAYYGTRAIHDLDLLRDTAIDANRQIPPLLSEATTRRIVQFHLSAISIIHEAPIGWKPTVQQSLTEVVKNLPAHERAIVGPYLALVQTVLTEVTR